jgi:hypothetical protein
MKLLLLIFAIAAGCSWTAVAQDKPPEYGWHNTLVAGLNVTQVSFHDWVQGGENTLAWTFLTTGKFVDDQEAFNWTNNLKLAYGQTKIGSREFEKTDDELFFESIMAYKLGWKVNPYAALLVRSQLAPGYKILNDIRTQTSGLFDPGYIQESVGFTYSSGEMFSTRLGAALRQTFSKKYGFADDPGTTEIEDFKFSTGVESASSFKYEVLENVLFTSQLNLFSAFDKLDVWDVRWDNVLTAKVNNYITTSVTVQLLHEIALSRRTQIKEVLALGLSYTLF